MKPWPSRLILDLVLLGSVALMVWWGFDICDRYGWDRVGIYLAALAVVLALPPFLATLRRSSGGGTSSEGEKRDRGDRPLDPSRLVRDYLEHQRATARRLRIGDIFDTEALPPEHTRVTLADIYVPLDVAEVETERVNDADFKRLSCERKRESTVPLFEAIKTGIGRSLAGLRAVLLGEPGMGKSSAVGDLILRFPRGAGGAALVLRFDLRRLGEAGADGSADAPGQEGPAGAPDSTRPFWRALRADLCECESTLLDPAADRDRAEVRDAVDQLRAGLKTSGLLLLDGLDEVLDLKRRRAVRDLVQALADDLGSGCAVLVTARPYVYPDAALNGFAVWWLQPLTFAPPGEPSQAADLIANWYRALGQDPAAARALVADLAADPGRADLATRPLLLTLLVALCVARPRRGRGRLPTDRAALIEESTTLFVDRWFHRIGLIRSQLPQTCMRH